MQLDLLLRDTPASTSPVVYTSPADLVVDNVYLDLSSTLGHRIMLKCEALNLAGSVKIKAARKMLSSALTSNRLAPGGTFIESSSGSLGVALAMLAAQNELNFICVTDTKSSNATIRLLKAYGAEVVTISEPHPEYGLLGGRLEYIANLLTERPDVVWLDQYSNRDNPGAHYETTGPQIASQWPDAQFVFIGAGTTGTLTGTARYLKDVGHPARIVALDVVGSTTFGGPPSPRFIPGLGTAKRPAIVDESVIDELIMVPEAAAIRMCRYLAYRGYLLGGSTGTVLSGAEYRLAGIAQAVTSVAISPDFGERYLDSVYDDDWTSEHYGIELTSTPHPGRMQRTARRNAQFHDHTR